MTTELRVVDRKRAACLGMLFPGDPRIHFSRSDRFGKPIIVFFEIDITIKRHRNIPQ